MAAHGPPDALHEVRSTAGAGVEFLGTEELHSSELLEDERCALPARDDASACASARVRIGKDARRHGCASAQGAHPPHLDALAKLVPAHHVCVDDVRAGRGRIRRALPHLLQLFARRAGQRSES